MTTLYEADRGDWDGDTPDEGEDKKMLDRIRTRYKYMVHAWEDIRVQAEKDDRALSISGPWDDSEREQRKKDGRPCIHLDQLCQHIHALVNEVRSNPVAIKVDPSGKGSDENTAELRSSRIKQIEYESNAVQAYQAAFESAAKRSFGAAGVKIEYKSWNSNQRVIKVRRFANAYSVLWDPDTVEADCSDMKDCFVLSRMSKDECERVYGKDSLASFGDEDVSIIDQWTDDDSVQIAEYWYTDYKPRHQIVFADESGEEVIHYMDEFQGAKIKKGRLIYKDGDEIALKSERKVFEPMIKMCITNGLNVLKQENGEKYIDWPGKWIPLGICMGEEDFIKSGTTVKRIINSYIRKARDGQMLFDFYKSNEAEIIGMSPKVPYVLYEGQDEGHEGEWAEAHKAPRAALHVKAVTEASGDQLLSLPRREVFEPPVQALEIGAESARRSIQSAVASYGFIRQDDTNVKSGIALQQLQSQNQLGSAHFIDNYKTFIRHMGRIINDLLDNVEGDKPMTVGTRDQMDNYKTVEINKEDKEGKVNKYSLSDDSQHEVTISTGPSFQSQRQEAAMVVDVMVQNIDKLPMAPESKNKIMGLLIKLKQLGPIGDAIEEIFNPDPGKVDPAQMQAEIQQWMQLADQLGQKIQQLEQELKFKSMENEADRKVKLQIASIQADVEKLKIMADTMNTQNELDSEEAIAHEGNQLQREMKSVDKDIAKMSKNSGNKEKK